MRANRACVTAFLATVVILAAVMAPGARAQSDAPEYGIYDGNPGFMYHGSHKTEAVVELVQLSGRPSFRLSVTNIHGFSNFFNGFLYIGAWGVGGQFGNDQRDNFELAKGDITEAKVGHGAGGQINFEFHTKSKEYKVNAVMDYVDVGTYWFYSGPNNSPLEVLIKKMLSDFPSALADFQKVQHAGEAEIAAMNPDQARAKIQELQSEIAAAESRAENDDQQSATMKAQTDQDAAQGGIAGAIGEGVSAEAAAGFQQKAESERSKIALMKSQIEQLQVKIGAQAKAQMPPAAPAPAPARPMAAPMPVAATPAGFNGFVPSDDNNASLADTMTFIQNELTAGATVAFTIGRPLQLERITKEYSRVVADAQTCRVNYHERESGYFEGRTPNPPVDSNHELDLRGVQQLAVMPAEDDYKNLPDNRPVPVFSPAVFVLQIKKAGDVISPLPSMIEVNFLDANLADGMARAMLHAVNLCTAK